MESIVRDVLIDHLTRNELLAKCQHGFISGRSCSTQLLSVLEIWTKMLDEENNIDAVYLDFRKAFDTVPHRRLLIKLGNYGVDGKIAGWIQNFLEDRRQCVVVNGEKSGWTPVSSGIPQGSVLGPALFVSYINDLPEVVHSLIAMFADDAKLFRRIASRADCDLLQQDLDRLEVWSATWLLKFNAAKCKVMRLGRKSPDYAYNMGQPDSRLQLEETKLERDLGVQVDDQLKFSKHSEIAANKGTSLLAMIRRSYEYLDGPSLVMLFRSLVRPHLEYANVVWAPRQKKDVNMIENVQRRATKLIPDLKDLPYEDRLRRLKLPSLVYRRARGDMIEVYKYLHGIYKVDTSFLPTSEGSITRGHSLKLTKHRSRLQLRQCFFSQRVVDHWNSLTEQIVTAPTLNCFKSRLDKYWREYQYSLDLPPTRTRARIIDMFEGDDSEDQLTGQMA